MGKLPLRVGLEMAPVDGGPSCGACNCFCQQLEASTSLHHMLVGFLGGYPRFMSRFIEVQHVKRGGLRV